jgi:predicted secreted hydrolase
MVKLSKVHYLLIAIMMLSLGTWWLYKADILISSSNPVANSASTHRLASSSQVKSPQGGQQVTPDYVLAFPDDHGEHPLFDIEWWYLTANLNDEQGMEYGLQWTLFRFRTPSEHSDKTGWSNNQLYMAHASVHSLNSHWFAEKFARGGVGNAGVESQPLQLYIDDWQWTNDTSTESEQQNLLPANVVFSAPLLNTHNDQAYATVQATLQLQASGPIVLQGEQGYSVKSADAAYASYYYSQPFIDVSGQLRFASSNGQVELSKEVNGQAWFDHEWTSQLVDRQTLGWDWLSLHLDDGSKIMAFRMRIQGQADFITGTQVTADGKQITLNAKHLSFVPIVWETVEARQLPLSWQLSIPQSNVDIQINSRKINQWNPALLPYYEGMVDVTGSHQGQGFLELTGY